MKTPALSFGIGFVIMWLFTAALGLGFTGFVVWALYRFVIAYT